MSQWVIIFKSYHRSYLFIDCDNPSIFSAITKNHIIIFVCYQPYLGFLEFGYDLLIARDIDSAIYSAIYKTLLGSLFSSVGYELFDRNPTFSISSRSPFHVRGKSKVDSKIFYKHFFNLSKVFSWKWNSNQPLPSRTWTSVCIMIQGSPSHGMSRSKQPFVLTRGLGTWGMTFWTRVIKITDKLWQNSNSKKLKQKLKKGTKNDKI